MSNIHFTAFRTGIHHCNKTVRLAQTLETNITCFTVCLVQNIRNLQFELFLVCAPRFVFKRSNVNVVNNGLHFQLFGFDRIHDFLRRLLIRYQVADSNTVCRRLHVFRNNVLQVVNEARRREISKVVTNALNHAACCRCQNAAVNVSAQNFSIAYFKHVVRCGIVVASSELFGFIFHTERRQNLRQNLKIRDFLCGVAEQRWVYVLVTHQQIHRHARIKPGKSASSKLVDTKQRVLKNTDD